MFGGPHLVSFESEEVGNNTNQQPLKVIVIQKQRIPLEPLFL